MRVSKNMSAHPMTAFFRAEPRPEAAFKADGC